VLADLNNKRRQLRHLVARRRAGRLALFLAEDVAAAAALRPVVDDLRHPLDRKQRSPVTRMPRLGARLAPRPARTAALPQPGRVVARRQRRVTGVALQPLLELLDPLRERGQLSVLRLQSRRQRHQRLDDRLASRRVDRLRLRALHIRSFAARNGSLPTGCLRVLLSGALARSSTWSRKPSRVRSVAFFAIAFVAAEQTRSAAGWRAGPGHELSPTRSSLPCCYRVSRLASAGERSFRLGVNAARPRDTR
jgi:hypothetical protein